MIKEKKTEKRERKIVAFVHAWKTKNLFNYVRLVGKYAFFLQNSFLAIRMLIRGKLMQTGWSKEEELVKNAIFRFRSPVVTKGLTLSSMF